LSRKERGSGSAILVWNYRRLGPLAQNLDFTH
jgi:hypothetical protein